VIADLAPVEIVADVPAAIAGTTVAIAVTVATAVAALTARPKSISTNS
jgi:hypothetical protein